MMQIAVEGAINTMVELVLPRFSPDNVVLLVEVDVVYANYNKDIEARRSINLCFHRPANYTKVFYLPDNAIGDVMFFGMLREKYAKQFSTKWVLESNHDSCWRYGTRQILNRVEDELMEQAEMEYPLCKKGYSTHISFSITGPSLYIADVERKKDFNGFDVGDREYTVLFKGQKIESKIVMPEVVNETN